MTDEKDAEIAALKARLEALEKAAQGSGPSTQASEPPPEPPVAEDNSKKVLWITGAIVLVIAFMGFCSLQGGGSDAPPATTSDAALEPLPPPPDAEPEPEMPPEPVSDWTYDDRQDPMTDAYTRTGCTTSSNQAYLSSPYRPTNARLCIRQSPQHGLDVYVHLLGDGQIICRSYRNCTVPVRFGEGAQQSFSATDAADGSSDIVFITNASRFIAAAGEADVIRVQLTFYRDGDQVLEFPSAGLEWPRPTPAD